MNNNTKYAIETSAFLGLEFVINQFLGTMFCPTLNQLGANFFLYNFYVNDIITNYETNKEDFYNIITSSDEKIGDFITLISYFKKYKEIYFKEDKFYIKDYTIIKQDDEEEIDKDSLVINFIDKSNVNIFMDTLRVLHWQDSSNSKEYKPANKIAEEMLKRAAKLKAEIKNKVKKNENESGFLEIMSSICARHPSINQLNIKDLNYYQIIDQFYRLQMIDEFGMKANAWSSGVLDEKGIKEMQKKHYTNKIKIDR